MIQSNELPKSTSMKMFGVEFSPLTRKDLPVLIEWRNNQLILPFLDECRYVNIDVMNIWFNKIKKSNNYLAYLASKNNQAFGYVEIKNIDKTLSCCETGYFLFGEKYIGTGLGLYLVLFTEVIMHKLKINNHIGKIHKDNIKAINFAKSYGLTVSHFENDFIIYNTTKERRLSRLLKIVKYLKINDEFEYYMA